MTLGRGYDMGSRTRDEVLTHLLNAGVSVENAERYAGGAGLTGVDAKSFVQSHHEEYGEISRRVQRRLFEDVVYPKYARDAATTYNNAVERIPNATTWEELDSRIREVAIDLTYQQGVIYRRQMPYVVGNDPESLATYIETTPELSQYEAGRHRAAYLRRE